jgi:hypothetical protein
MRGGVRGQRDHADVGKSILSGADSVKLSYRGLVRPYLRRMCARNLCHVLADLEKTTPSHGSSHLALN